MDIYGAYQLVRLLAKTFKIRDFLMRVVTFGFSHGL